MRQPLLRHFGWGVRVIALIFICVFIVSSVSNHVIAQGFGLPDGAAAAPPSLQANPNPAVVPNAFASGSNSAGPADAKTGAQHPASSGTRKAAPGLPNGNGQEMRTYDLRPYTGYLTKNDHPQQAVVDWVLRETGSDVWFTEPFGFMSASRDTLSVYHTAEMHGVIGSMVDRFVAGEKDPQIVNLRMLTVGSPNWRTRTHALMQHVSVDSPGVQAWLLTKENVAIVMSTLRQRTDVREIQAVDLVTHNGQTEKLASVRGRNYVQNIRQAPTGWPPYEPQTGEVQEGYQIEISPLLAVDRKSVDCVIKAQIDQVDKLVPVDLDLPLPSGEQYRARIEVPQVVSWRLNERFRWPTDMVLVLSCGVVASPERSATTLPLWNLNSLTGTTAGRADALMFIEFRGRATENLPSATPQVADRNSAVNRGRY